MKLEEIKADLATGAHEALARNHPEILDRLVAVAEATWEVLEHPRVKSALVNRHGSGVPVTLWLKCAAAEAAFAALEGP